MQRAEETIVVQLHHSMIERAVVIHDLTYQFVTTIALPICRDRCEQGKMIYISSQWQQRNLLPTIV